VLDISLVMATTALLVSAAVAAAGGVVPFAIAQEEQASLGEEDDTLADGIVSDVLDDQNVVDQHNTAEQDAANTNVDSDVQVGGEGQLQAPPSTTEPPGPTPPPPPPPPPTEEEDTTPPTLTVPEDMTVGTNSPDAVVSFEVTAQDNVDGTAILDENNMLHQDDVGGSIIIS
jgi:hypothetical protein